MATPRQRSKGGRWTHQVYVGGHLRHGTFDTYAQAKRWEADIKAKAARGERVDHEADTITMADLWVKFLRIRRAKGGAARATLSKNETHWRLHIEPTFGHRPVRRVRRSEVRAWLGELEVSGSGDGLPTKEACLRLLSGLFRLAIEDELIGTNPAAKMSTGKHRTKVKNLLVLDDDRQVVLDLIPDPHDRLLLELMVVTGLRIGEALGLRGMDVNPQRGRVYVEQVWTRHGIKDRPKSEDSERSVPVPPYLMKQLLALHAVGSARLFSGDDRNLNRRVLAPACRAAGVPVVTLHGLRHTAATKLLASGHTTFEVSKVLGHGDTRMVERHYGKMTDDGLDAVARTMQSYGQGKRKVAR